MNVADVMAVVEASAVACRSLLWGVGTDLQGTQDLGSPGAQRVTVVAIRPHKPLTTFPERPEMPV